MFNFSVFKINIICLDVDIIVSYVGIRNDL